jgi:flavin-binding protein dodecin
VVGATGDTDRVGSLAVVRPVALHADRSMMRPTAYAVGRGKAAMNGVYERCLAAVSAVGRRRVTYRPQVLRPWSLARPRDTPQPYGRKEAGMSESIYRVTEVIGTSPESWEDATRHAVETAARTLRDLRVGEVVKLDVTIEEGRVTTYRARVNISFKYDVEHAEH